MTKQYKTVKMLIRVPAGHHCWEGMMDGAICSYFDNIGGYAHCSKNLGEPEPDNKNGGYKKPIECDKLEEE
jgi:hypothetical protein